jgi:hypothetical protein
MEHAQVLALDPLYGVTDDGITDLRVIRFVGDSGDFEYFYVAASEDEAIATIQLQRWYRRTMDSNHDDLIIMGDFWPIEVGVGQGYDVYVNQVPLVTVHWLEGEGVEEC